MAWPRLSLMTMKRSRSSRTTAIVPASSGRAPARAWPMRSVSSSRLGRPVVGSYRAPRWATSTRRALSRPIDASLAKLVSASMSRLLQRPVGGPDGQAQDADDPVPPEASGTPTTAAEGPERHPDERPAQAS